MPTPRGKGGQQPPPPTPPVRTGGGGDDDEVDTEDVEQVAQASLLIGDEEDPIIKHRRDIFSAGKATESRLPDGYEFSFDSASLLGSWFHRLENDTIVWQGMVLAEPSHAVYLVEIEQMAPGAKNVQRLIKLDQMTNDEEGYDWRFYDSREDAMLAYQEWSLTERERA